MFRGRHFEDVIILLCVRWYLRYSLTYRDLEEIMAEGNLSVDHVTIWRWVQRYAPILNHKKGQRSSICDDPAANTQSPQIPLAISPDPDRCDDRSSGKEKRVSNETIENSTQAPEAASLKTKVQPKKSKPAKKAARTLGHRHPHPGDMDQCAVLLRESARSQRMGLRVIRGACVVGTSR
jgi:hypothetical protein